LWEHRLLRFEYAYVGLPALDAEQYATGEHVLGAALSALMRVPAERHAELHAEALKRIALSGENDCRRFLLAECLEAYGQLDEGQRQRLQASLTTEAYQEARPLLQTTYERGQMEGYQRGIAEGQRKMALRLLEAKFGPLSPEVKHRGLLDAIEGRDYDVYSSRVRLSSWRKLLLAVRAMPLRWDWA
jgi:phytoene/squalene synthetase